MKRVSILGLIVLASMLALTRPAATQTVQGGQDKIPAWLAESETYGFGVGLEAMEGTAWKFITHVPDTAEFLGEARRRGVRTFPYMTFYQAYLAMTYQDFRLSDHPDWILINSNGRWAHRLLGIRGRQEHVLHLPKRRGLRRRRPRLRREGDAARGLRHLSRQRPSQ
jgi:hypothetical protein